MQTELKISTFLPLKHDFIWQSSWNVQMLSPSTTRLQIRRTFMDLCIVAMFFLCDLLLLLFFLKEGFRKAMQMVGEEFLDRLEFYQSSWLPARAVVEEAVKKRHQVGPCSFWAFSTLRRPVSWRQRNLIKSPNVLWYKLEKAITCALQTPPTLLWPLLECDAFTQIYSTSVFLELFSYFSLYEIMEDIWI